MKSMKQYTIAAGLAADWRRVPGGALLRDADGYAYLVPDRAAQRALGPERYTLSADEGRAVEIGALVYPVTLVLHAPGHHGTTVVPGVSWKEVGAAIRTLSRALEA